MKQLFEVKLVFKAIVLAEDSYQAERIATEERGEIVSDCGDPDEVDAGVTFRSRDELSAHAALTQCQWDAMCIPYGGDGNTRIGEILDQLESYDRSLQGRCTKTADMFDERDSAPQPEPEALDGAKPPQQPEPPRPPDFRLLVARRHAKAGDHWQWCSMEYIGDNETGGALIEGGEPNVMPDGKLRWTGVPTERVFVTEEQVRQEALAYEARTGKCMQCAGSGLMYAGWNHVDGNRYATCNRCAGRGKAVAL